VAPADIELGSDTYLLKPNAIDALLRASKADSATDVGNEQSEDDVSRGVLVSAFVTTTDAGTHGATRIRIRGNVPIQQWNRLGTKLLPRLRAIGTVTAAISLECDASAAAVSKRLLELKQTLHDLGLTDQLQIDVD
jgi:hypothetical protein